MAASSHAPARPLGASREPEPLPEPARGRRREALPWLIAGLLGAVAVIGLNSSPGRIDHHPLVFGLLLALVVGLDLVRVDLFERANVSPASVPTLALAFLFGPLGPLASEAILNLARVARREAPLRVGLDLGMLGLAGAASAEVYGLLAGGSGLSVLGAGLLGATAYYLVNIPVLSVVLAVSEGLGVLTVWRERLAWLWPHYLIFGVLAATIVLAERAMGAYGLLVFAVPLLVVWLTEKQYVDRSRASVEQLRLSHSELEVANERLRGLLSHNEQLLEQVKSSYLGTITSLARTIEAKDPYTAGHTDRVSRLACLLAGELGLGGADLEAVEVGGVVHDIGKIGIPDAILLKPGRLDEEEFAAMRRHPQISSYILDDLDLPLIVKQMARSHHERFDGRGYPDRLSGQEIPLAARVLTVADTLDAMTSDRPYRSALPLSDAVAEIEALAGDQFCPRVVSALQALLRADPSLDGMYLGQTLAHRATVEPPLAPLSPAPATRV